MHWTNPFFISQIIQIVVLAVLLRGIFLTIKAISKMEDKYSTALVLILCSLTAYMLLAVVFSLLLYQKTPYENFYWLLPPAIGLVGALILVIGGGKLFQAINAPEGE